MAQAYGLDPYALRRSWTWPQLWLMYRSLEDAISHAKRKSDTRPAKKNTGETMAWSDLVKELSKGMKVEPWPTKRGN